jgi:hypothetical protein
MSDQVSGLIALHFYKDNSGNLTTATPVDQPLAGGAYHVKQKMPQDGCLRAIIARIETTPNTANPDLVASMTIGGVEDATGHVDIPIGDTDGVATFANGEVPFDEDDEIGASVMQTGGTIDDAVDETYITLILQLGKSNI